MRFKSGVLTLILLFTAIYTIAQDADAVLGIWQSEHGSARIQISKSGDSYKGKLVWLKDGLDAAGQQKADINNPDQALRDQPVKGMEVLSDFTYKGPGLWEEGTVYDPRSGKRYSCKMSMTSSDELEIRAFKGISLIGKTQLWLRLR